MPNVLDLIEALDVMYFNETSSIERYNILHKLEEAISQMRMISSNEIKNAELAGKHPSVEQTSTDITSTDEFLLLRIIVVVGDCTPDIVNITMQTKVLDIEKYSDVDSLAMMEILVGIEEILDIDLLSHTLSDDTTIQDLFNMRN